MVAYKEQWGTLHVLFRARSAMTNKQVVDLFGPTLARAYGTPQKPALWSKRLSFVTRMDFVNEVSAFEGIAKPYSVSMGASSDMDEDFDRYRLTMMQNGEPDPAYARILHAVKWNVRSRDRKAVTKEDGGEVRSAMRELFRKHPNIKSVYVDFTPYGVAPGKAMPVPTLPALPPRPRRPAAPVPPPPVPVEPKKGNPVGWLLLALGAARALSGKG